MLSYSLSYLDIAKTIPYLRYNIDHNQALLLVFNQSNPIFKDKEVRVALNYVVNKDSISSRFVNSYGINTGSLASPLSSRFNSDIAPYPYSPKKALELLEQAGWKRDPFSGKLMKEGSQFQFEVMIAEGKTVLTDLLESIRSDFDQVGIEMKVTLLTLDEMSAKMSAKRSTDNFFISYSGSMPIYYDWLFWRSAEQEANYLYRNSMVNQLLDEARFNRDIDQSAKAYQEFQKVIHEDPPALYIFWQPVPIFYSARIRGLNTDPLLTFRNLHEVWIEE